MKREIINQLTMYAVTGLIVIVVILAVPVLSWFI